MSNSITQDMKYRQSLMKYADKYGVLMHVYSIKWYDIIKIMKVKNVGDIDLINSGSSPSLNNEFLFSFC